MIGVYPPIAVEPVDVGSGGVDERAGPHLEPLAGFQIVKADQPVTVDPTGVGEFDVVGHRRARLDGRADKAEDEARVVVAQVGVAIFDAAAHTRDVDGRFGVLDRLSAEQPGGPGSEPADAPIGGRSECCKPRGIR